MAVFERKKEDKIIIDDTKPFILEITETQNVDDHVEYDIEVCRYPDIEEKWIVSHRYSDFVNLHSMLKTPTIALPSLPPKRVFGNTEKEFISHRKASLQCYLDGLVRNYLASVSPQFRRFVDPITYDGTFADETQQNLLTALRSTGSHEITQNLPNIGTRARKKYFLGRPLSNPKSQHLLWWASYGPDRMKHLRDVHATLTALLHIKHCYIVSGISCIATDSGVCVVRPWFPQGTLRDFIYGVKPQFDFLFKYTNNKRRSIPINICAVYGRQILEALSFLHDKGIAHGSLHTGNIVIENNVCQLLEIENQVLGLPHPFRSFMTKIRKLNSLPAIDIYCFGHVLYEMVYLNPLNTEICDDFPKESSPLCRSVLESILSSEACKNGLPSASALLTHPFFNEVPLRSYEKPFLRLSSGVKNAIATTYELLLDRLEEDQRKVKLLRQKSRAEAALFDDHYPVNFNKKVLKEEKPNTPTRKSERENVVPVINESSTLNSGIDSHDKVSNSPLIDSRVPSSIYRESEGDPESQISPSPSPSSSLRSQLLSSISNFNKNTLRRKSQPVPENVVSDSH